MSRDYLQPYSTYSDTGEEWLVSIPSSWELHKGKRLFANRREVSQPDDDQLAASQQYGVIPQSLMMEMNDARVMLALKGTSTFRHVERGDFVISLRSFEGGIEYSDYKGCVSPAYTVLAALKELDKQYFRHLFKSGPFVAALQSTTDSLRDGKAISYSQFGSLQLPLPPLEEQTQIARFLDYETAKIDALIEKQQQLIALLNEKRQAVISHAVTKGLNQDVPMRNSGVEWLGEVPAHWEVKKVKYTCLLESGHTPRRTEDSYWVEEECTIPWVSLNDTKTLDTQDYIADTKIQISHAGMKNSSAHFIPAGAVVFNRDGARVGLAAITVKPMCVSQHIIAWVCGPQILNEYLLHVIYAMRPEIYRITWGSTIPTIGMGDIKQMVCPVPPMSEQRAIAKKLFRLRKSLSHAESCARRSIRVLEERRAALISAAVTGKIDVRSWKASEPEIEAEAI